MNFILEKILGIVFLICMYLLYKDKIFKKNNIVPKNIVQEDFEDSNKIKNTNKINNNISNIQRKINELKK
jgi:hypothetical protein